MRSKLMDSQIVGLLMTSWPLVLSACSSDSSGASSLANSASVTRDGGPAADAADAADAANAERDASLTDTADASLLDAAVPEWLQGCPIEQAIDCPSSKPHYADVKPIFTARCTGCHDGMHGQWALDSYEPVADWFGEIRGELSACTMPPIMSGVQMPVSERIAILEWIRCGLPE
jgi:hypothetical protein